jgi:hypothetical protein
VDPKYLKFKPTPENVDLLSRIYAQVDPENQPVQINPTVLKKLLQHPLARIGFMWGRSMEHHGLSPFAYAGITQVPPKRILEALTQEGTFTGINYCETTQLPIVNMSYRIQRDFWPSHLEDFRNRYDEEVSGRAVDERLDPEYFDGERASRSARWENRTLEKMLKRYGGKTWKRHCKRVFDPFHALEMDGYDPDDSITPTEWRLLKRVYFLEEKMR